MCLVRSQSFAVENEAGACEEGNRKASLLLLEETLRWEAKQCFSPKSINQKQR